MEKRERVRAALNGAPVDRTPISFWRHFPERDRTPEGLAEVMVDFQRAYDLDFVKLMPTGMYPTQDYGCEIEVAPGEGGTTRLVSSPIRSAADWRRLGRLDVTRGVLGQQVAAVRLVRRELGDGVPIVQTVFSPATVAQKMAPDRFQAHLREDPAAVAGALAAIRDWSIDFALACVDAGCDGLFFGTQLASRRVWSEEEYRRWGVEYDVPILDAVAGRTWFNLVHIHGHDVFFDLLSGYPVQAVNWHDRETAPDLRAALSRTEKCLIGGIAREGAIRHGSPDAVAAEVRDAVTQTGGRRLIVGPGCVIPTGCPPENLRAARAAVEA